jgi:hypothetical protein
MMGGKANAFKILELSPFLPNARLVRDLQKRTGQQPADTEAEAVVQYLGE